MWLTFLTTLLNIIDLVLLLLIAVAYFTLAERKIMAGIQRRKGSNVIGYLGLLLQPLADGLKLASGVGGFNVVIKTMSYRAGNSKFLKTEIGWISDFGRTSATQQKIILWD